MCKRLDVVYVATCDEEIFKAVEAFGGKAVLTSPKHERASDRVAEAAKDLSASIVVMVQGDEPMVYPQMVDLAVEPLIRDQRIQCSNLVKRIKNQAEYRDPNAIKVVMDKFGDALYFSRQSIPALGWLGFDRVPVFKQVCIIPFRHDFLLEYADLEPTPLEQAESVDMLRILEHGFRIRLVESAFDTHSVDTPEDLAVVEEKMRSDKLLREYAAGGDR